MDVRSAHDEQKIIIISDYLTLTDKRLSIENIHGNTDRSNGNDTGDTTNSYHNEINNDNDKKDKKCNNSDSDNNDDNNDIHKSL